MAIPKIQYPTIFGDLDSRDLMDRPVPEVPPADLFDAIEKALAIYNELATDVVSTFALTSTIAKERFDASMLGGADSALLQPRGEYGRVLATQIAQEQGAESAFEVGYPIFAYGDRGMFTPEFLLRSTVRDVNNKTFDAMIRDSNTLFRYVLNANFQNENYDFTDDKVLGQNLGTYNVKRLLNADDIPGVFKKFDGAIVPFNTLNAYKVSGSAVFTNSTFAMAHDYLTDLGMDTDIIYLISKADEAAVRLLTDFVPFDPLPASINDPNIVEPPPISGTIVPEPRSLVRTQRSIGRIRSADGNSGEVIVLPWMFAGYLFAMDRAAEKPVVIRESDLAELRGFRLVSEDGMSPAIGGDKIIVNKFWQRVFGAGVRNRANGVIVQITVNAVYTPPSVFVTT
jgi:hypothetical protein